MGEVLSVYLFMAFLAGFMKFCCHYDGDTLDGQTFAESVAFGLTWPLWLAIALVKALGRLWVKNLRR